LLSKAFTGIANIFSHLRLVGNVNCQGISLNVAIEVIGGRYFPK
jgi:hypothetical protein